MYKIKSSILFLAILSGCTVAKQWVPTGGSRSDGTVTLSYDYGMFQTPQVDYQQGVSAAASRCVAWGYQGADPFGGQTKFCIDASEGSCNSWRVSAVYQCTGKTEDEPATTPTAPNKAKKTKK